MKKISLIATAAIVIATSISQASASQISAYIYNNIIYTQPTGSNAAPTTPNGYFFNIGADVISGNFTSASATYPGGSTQLSGTSPNFSYGSPLQSQAASAAAFPYGNYTVTATGTDTASATINYTKDLFTSTTPYLSNLTSLNGLDPSKAFTVLYNAFVADPSATEGFTFFTVFNSANTSVFDAGFQSPTTTQSDLAANTLLPNTTYTFQLDFSNRLEQGQDADGNFLQQGFDVRTLGEFTTGSIAPVPELSTWAMLLLGFAGLGIASRMRSRRLAGAAREH